MSITPPKYHGWVELCRTEIYCPGFPVITVEDEAEAEVCHVVTSASLICAMLRLERTQLKTRWNLQGENLVMDRWSDSYIHTFIHQEFSFWFIPMEVGERTFWSAIFERCHMWVSWNCKDNIGKGEASTWGMDLIKMLIWLISNNFETVRFFMWSWSLSDFHDAWFIYLFCTLGGAYSSGTCRCRWHPCRYHGGSSSMQSSPVKLTPNASWTGHLAEAGESSRRKDKFADTGRCLRVGSSRHVGG